jgi:hypothetical protein
VKEPELQAVADEVAAVLAEAALQWRAVKQSLPPGGSTRAA